MEHRTNILGAKENENMKIDYIEIIGKSMTYASFWGSLVLNYTFIGSAYIESCHRKQIHFHGGSGWLDKILDGDVIAFSFSIFAISFIPAFVLFFIYYYSKEKTHKIKQQ